MTERRPTLSIFPSGGAVPEADAPKPSARFDAPADPRRVALPPLPGARTIKHKATPVKAKHAWAETQLREAMRTVAATATATATAADETAPA